MDYSYIIIPIIVGITSQALKLLTDGVKGNFDLKNLFINYGGMPSSHTAFSVSIATPVGLRLGFGSAWRSLVGAEMLVVTLGGLGKFIWMAQWYFDFDKVMAGIVLIGLISILVEQLVLGRLEKNILQKWGFNREYAGGSD